ncbi:MAG: adenosine kinase [Hyphomicrobiaceae bacterium]|nr:adenosine kinase [Hyphomicrobiaceae bacterium]
MTATHYDVVGIGNAIVDIIARCDDAMLAKHGMAKGHMRLVDGATIAALYDGIGPAVEISGGSAANTLAGIASLGGRGGFIGKVADDEFGRIFAHDIRSIGVAFTASPVAGGEPTARCLILVTPDGERTMNTFLGISPAFEARDIDAEMIAAAEIVYLEGYLFDRPAAKEAFRTAAAIAKRAGRRVALSLSDGFCVDRHRDEFRALVRDEVDILIANESEITSLYQTTDFEAAARQAAADTRLAALTRSAMGSVIIAGGERIAVPATSVAAVVDTTGAGDLYASGFLYGVATAKPLDIAGRLGSLAAAEVIGHVGARPQVALAALAREHGLL